MKIKVVLSVFLVGLFLAAGVWYYVFVCAKNHHRSAADETCIVVSAGNIVKEYQANEAASNTKYLNKALQISGLVSEVKKDQIGNTTVTIKSEDPFASVFCTLTDKETALPVVGKQVSVKGICTGFLSDVVIADAVLAP